MWIGGGVHGFRNKCIQLKCKVSSERNSDCIELVPNKKVQEALQAEAPDPMHYLGLRFKAKPICTCNT